MAGLGWGPVPGSCGHSVFQACHHARSTQAAQCEAVLPVLAGPALCAFSNFILILTLGWTAAKW